MTDLAALSFSVDSRPVAQGTADLAAFGAQSTRTAGAMDDASRRTRLSLVAIGSAADQTGASVQGIASRIASYVRGVLGSLDGAARGLADGVVGSISRIQGSVNSIDARPVDRVGR
ncbi:MAG TPA: hypothetical protein VF633_02525, partial [Brevundimonas sp.]